MKLFRFKCLPFRSSQFLSRLSLNKATNFNRHRQLVSFAVLGGAAAMTSAVVLCDSREGQSQSTQSGQFSNSTNSTNYTKELPAITGSWLQDKQRSESLAPFLKGLGVPSFAVFFVDMITTTLDISFEEQNGEVTVIGNDQTIFGTNTTQVVIGGPEAERLTRNKRKKFMISAGNDGIGIIINCRLFQRGDGWYTKQRWSIADDGALQEEMILCQPGLSDVVVNRYFNSVGEIQTSNTQQTDEINNYKYYGAVAAAVIVGGIGMWYVRGHGDNDKK